MKKNLSVALILVMVLAILAACSGNNGNNASNDQDQAGNDKSNEPVTLTAMVQNHPAYPFNEDWLIWDVYKERLNVNIEASAYQGNWWESIPLIIASGDLPDLMWMSGVGMIHEYGNDGALINLMEHLDKMPNLKKFIEENPEDTAVMLSADGELYMPPSKGAYAETSSLFLYREDIFEKHNLSMPENYDELYETLKKLKEFYPDSYPLMIDKLNNLIYGFAASWGTGDIFYYNTEKGEMAYGPMEDNFRDMIEYFRQLYAEGLIPIDFLTLDSSQKDQLITNDQSFIYFGYTNQLDSYNKSVQENKPEFKMAGMIPPEGPAGRFGSYQIFITEGLGITSTTEKLDDALAFIDWLYTEEGRDAVSWGIEGETYEVVDGQKKYTSNVTDLTSLTRDYGIKSSGNFQWFDQEAWLSLQSEETVKAQEIALEYMKPAVPVPAFTQEEANAIGIQSDTIGKYYNENISKFIMGERPLSEWDDYVEGLKDLGIEDVLQVWQQAYERQQAQL